MKVVIMAGGLGTRFWPMSRAGRPKQFLPIVSRRTMLQETVRRLRPLVTGPDIFVICSQRYVSLVVEQLPDLDRDQIIVEPAARNTAPCVGLAALYLKRRGSPQEVMAALPADHVIEREEEFHEMLRAAEALAQEGWLVTFGIQPRHPATGYGYLKRGERIGLFQGKEAFRVDRFTEKPDAEKARQFLREGDYFWNSGMFVWRLDRILEEMRRCMPETYRGLLEIDRCWDDSRRVGQIFEALEKTSIDYGVMERAEKVAMLPCDLGWNDVGNWKAVAEVSGGDQQGIFATVPVVAVDSRNVLVHTVGEKLVALVGVEDLVYVETDDAVLICHRERTEEVRQVVEELESRGEGHLL